MKILTTSVLGLMALAMASQAHAEGNRPATVDSSATSTSRGTLTSGISKDEIREGQTALNSELAVGLTEDGVMGPATRAAIRQFQVEQGLAVTGEFDTATLQTLGIWEDESLDRAPASVPLPTSPVPHSPDGTRGGEVR